VGRTLDLGSLRSRPGLQAPLQTIPTRKCMRVRHPRRRQSRTRVRARSCTRTRRPTTQTHQMSMTRTRLSTSSRPRCLHWQHTGPSGLCHGARRPDLRLSCSVTRPQSRMTGRPRVLGRARREDVSLCVSYTLLMSILASPMQLFLPSCAHELRA
jgi:hypothetical protein